MNNKKVKIPIIEQVVIIGLDNAEIHPLLSKPISELNKIKKTKYGNIINSYSSIHTNEPLDKELLSKLPYYCYPKGIIEITSAPLKKRALISFSLLSKTSHKHCTCLSINIIIHSCESYILSTNTGIVLISSKELYISHKEILERLCEIIHPLNPNSISIVSPLLSSGGRSNSLSAINSLLYSSQLSTTTRNKIEDHSSIDFFLSFILNSLYYSKTHYGKLSNSLCVNLISNNSKQTNQFLFKVYLDDNGNESVISLKDYDISILLEKFYSEDLLKIYLAMLMEYRVIIVYDNNTSLNELNLIVNSLIALIFPLPSKHYLLIPYLNQRNFKEDVLNILSGIIIGIEYNHYVNIEKELMISKTIIFSLIRKKIIYINEGFPSCPNKTQNELTGNLYQTLADKLSINSELSFEDTELGQMFDERTCVKINTILYFNMKVQCIFYHFFLKIISSFNPYIKYNNSKPQSLSSSSNRYSNSMTGKGNTTHDLFNYTQYREDNTNQTSYQRFLNDFSNSKMFSLFLKKYINNFKSKAKYRFINQMLDVMAPKTNFNQSIKRTFNICIKKKLTEYYNFTYINYTKAYDNYLLNLIKMKDNYNTNATGSNSNWNSNYYNSIASLFKINSALVKKCNEDYENCIIKTNDLLKKFEFFNIYKEIQSCSMPNSQNNNSMNKSTTIATTTINNNLNSKSDSAYAQGNRNELTSPLLVSPFDLNMKKNINEITIPANQFFNKEEIMVINEEEFKSIDSNSNEKQLLTESKVFQMPLASKQPIQIGSVLQEKKIDKTNMSSAMTKYNLNTRTKKKKVISEKNKNNNETIGQQIKAKLHSNYLSNKVNSASNKNLVSLIKNMSLVSSKISCQNRYELPIQNEMYSTRNAHSAIKRDIISLNNNINININNKKGSVNNNNLPKLEGDNDCDIFSEND